MENKRTRDNIVSPLGCDRRNDSYDYRSVWDAKVDTFNENVCAHVTNGIRWTLNAPSIHRKRSFSFLRRQSLIRGTNERHFLSGKNSQQQQRSTAMTAHRNQTNYSVFIRTSYTCLMPLYSIFGFQVPRSVWLVCVYRKQIHAHAPHRAEFKRIITSHTSVASTSDRRSCVRVCVCDCWARPLHALR